MRERPPWLIPGQHDRRRLLDMERRLRRPRAVTLGLLALAVVVCAPWLGLWPVAAAVVAATTFWIASRDLERKRHPEYWMAGSWALSLILIAVSVALTGGPESPGVAWMALPA